MGTFRDFKSSFPQESHAKGKAFEGFLVDWFFKQHPLYRHKFEKVWLWEDWPKPEGVAAQDLGTDLIALDTEGKIYAIQAKFYDVDSQIKFKDISTFLADSSKDYIDHRLLIGTAELAPNARKQLNSQEKSVSTFLLHDFEAWDFDWPTSLASLAKAKLKKPHEARPHQQAAIKDVCAKLDGRGQLIMACGTGKTLTGQRIAEELGSETTLVLLPSLLLLSGTMNEWLQQTKVGFHYLPVCSDASVGRKAAPETNFTSGELGNASTTDPKEIREFLKQKGNKVIFSTYQSSGRVADALKGTRIRFDLILADEAHRCAGKVAADYGYVLDEKKLPAKNRLFMTATPRIYKSNIKKAAKDADIEIASMDDESVFGPVVHHLTFGQAIDQELLTDYQVVVVGVNDAAVDEMVENRALVKTEAGLERDAATLGSQLGLMKAVRKYDLQRVITFHSRINQARDYAAEFQEVIDATKPAERPTGTITYSHVSGAMPTAERTNKLRALGLLEHEDRYLLGNARCLSEGVDVPALDGVAFVDPRRSEIDIIQAVGRAIRKSSNKTKGTIIIPVFIAEGDDPDEVLSSSAFDQVWKVVNALRAHDEKLGEELDQLRRAEGQGERVSIKDTKLVFDVHESVGESFLQAFETKLVEATTASWEFWFGLLQVYRTQHGDCLVPQGYITQTGLRLGNWVSTQRQFRAELAPEKIDALDEIGFVWNVIEHDWQRGLEALRAFKRENGHLLVPACAVIDGFKIGVWVSTVRTHSSNYSAERLQELEKMGFIWNAVEYKWEEAFAQLQLFKEMHGHCDVSAREKFNGFALGTWVANLRSNKERQTVEKIHRLDELGFSWAVIDGKWNRSYEALKKYAHEHGGLERLPRGKVNGIDLSTWSTRQRQNKAHLSDDQISKLDDIGFIWDPSKEVWEKGIAGLKAFQQEHGHRFVPKSYKQGDFNLGFWVLGQRKRIDSLTPERVDQLRQSGFVFNYKDELWEEMFLALKKLQDQNGHQRIPSSFKANGIGLSHWAGSQRRNKSDLSPAQIAKLDSISFQWNPLEDSWNQHFAALLEYGRQHGNLLVPSNCAFEGLNLGQWVSEQRKRKDKMSQSFRDRLDEAGFSWDQLEARWELRFLQLTEWKARFGDCIVSKQRVTNAEEEKLINWTGKQRMKFAELSNEKRERLTALGFIADPFEEAWTINLKALVAYKAEFGDCLVPYDLEYEGLKLGQWVSKKRTEYRQGKLADERAERLREIGFIWEPTK